MHNLRWICLGGAGLLLIASGVHAQNWPQFRGPNASGVSEGAKLPVTWDVSAGRNVRWKTAVPGFGFSSPVVWGDRIFLTTAVDAEGGQRSWRLLALDKATGKVVWERNQAAASPKVGKHEKASFANSTPATDGQRIAAILGESELFMFDFTGKELWKHDLGPLDPGFARDATSHWGYGSSPVLDDGRVYVQVDRHANSFLAAFDAATGQPLWTARRDELSSWATPVVAWAPGGAELVTSSVSFIRGYNPKTGEELWRYASGAPVKVPTPVLAGELIIVAGGYPRGQPLVALRAGGRGDISDKAGEASPFVAWRTDRGGPYVPSPIVYQDRLFFCTDAGRVYSYDAKTGRPVYRGEVAGNFSASPVAGDGKIYLPSEEGDLHVVKAGDKLEILATNSMDEPLMATPAISGDTLFIRTRGHLYAIAEETQENGGKEVKPAI
jgi:outer membrane protein assembly factor BamB